MSRTGTTRRGAPAGPPARRPRTIETLRLAAGTRLSRVYRAPAGVCGFNQPVAAPWQGGRFDGDAAHPYGCLYAGSDDDVAVAETLLRDADPAERYHYLPEAQLAGRMLGWLAPTRDVMLVKLHGTGLHAIGQGDGWLVMTDARDYERTREWAHALRRWARSADGFVWRSKRFTDGHAYVLFDDRCGRGALRAVAHPAFAPESALALSGPGATVGRAYLKTLLLHFHWTLVPE